MKETLVGWWETSRTQFISMLNSLHQWTCESELHLLIALVAALAVGVLLGSMGNRTSGRLQGHRGYAPSNDGWLIAQAIRSKQ